MTALLDTHVLLWLLDGSSRLGPGTRAWLERQPRVHVSAASLWEIAIKEELGKLAVPGNLTDLISASGTTWLPVSPSHSWATRSVTGLPHRDPFDRLLLAQAAEEDLTLVTADVLLRAGEVSPSVRRRDARE